MVVLRTQSEYGYAPPPQTQYSIITNLPGWHTIKAVRDGDSSPLDGIMHIYPRFGPIHAVTQLGQEIARALGIEGKTAYPYLNPDMWPFTRRHISSHHRGQAIMKPEDIELRCVDVAGHRLYVVFFDPKQNGGVMLSWGNPGLGLSVRGAEMILKGSASLIEVSCGPVTSEPPQPTWTPEGEAHQGLKRRVDELLHHAAIAPENVTCTPDDVFLYPTGMAAVFHTTNLLLDYRPGTIVVAGVVFHNTFHHLIEECPHGWKHHGRVDEEGLDQLELWLQDEKTAGRTVSYLLYEFPGNPTLDTPNIVRLKKLSEKFNFVLLADDTIAGFANIDIFAHADLLLTSLTKSFSGQANVMGGSVVLNPLSPHYASLSPLFFTHHHNELFASDADTLLSNSQTFFARTQILNRNARAMAHILHASAADPASPVVRVQYPTVLPTKPNYDAFLRKPTPEMPEPGYGCLLTVEFECVTTAAAFFDRCGFYPSPHLGGHVTIMFPYNLLVFTKKAEEAVYMRGNGVKEEAVRISAGLEDENDLVDTLNDALQAAIEAKNT